MKKVHIVPHMHWDREWYFTTEESRILLVNNMEEILDMLENHPDYPYYVLDGQTAILEDYFAVKPENKERVKKLVQEGKLIIGPWYTQTDEMVVGAESIVRNLLYGLKDSAAFGAPMMIGYLPDSFGQSAQMPQILNGFDIKHAIFWRGTSERHGTDRTEFYWESLDGSKVLVQLLPLGYAIGKYLPEDEEALKSRMDKYFSVLDRGATTDHLLLPNGHDQMPIQKNIFTVIDKLKKLYPDREFFLSRYEHVFHELEKNTDLATIQGEFLDGKYMRVHRSIYSSRMDIKAANTRIENKITNILEPLASIAYSLGFDYHHGLIEAIWKEIMKNHAHDSIGCCCSDKVHREILNRFFIAEEKTDQLIEFYKRKITDSIHTGRKEDRLAAFNLLPYERNEVVTTKVITKLTAFKLEDADGHSVPFEILNKAIKDPGLIDRQIVHYGNYDPFYEYTIHFKDTLPPMGYKTYWIAPSDQQLVTSFEPKNKVETDFYVISVNTNGTLNILDKRLNKTFRNVLLLENGADDGDEYDYSPLADEALIYSDAVEADVKMAQNQWEAHVDIRLSLEVPSNLEKRKQQITDSRVDVHWSITVPNDRPLMKIHLEIDNHAKDHRLRALIPTGIASDFSIADNQFGIIKRAVYDNAMDYWEKENWDERPDAIYPMLSFVGLSDDTHGLAILTNSTREYEIVGENYDTIAVTLFRSVGVLGKEELLRRPGRPSGIKLPVPDSQMLGPLTLDFALTTHPGRTEDAGVARLAKEYNTPIETYNKIPFNAMKLNPSENKTPIQFSLLRERNVDLGNTTSHEGCANPAVTPESGHKTSGPILSTLKKAESENRLVLRFYNPSETKIQAAFEWLAPDVPTRIDEANLNEKPLAPIKGNGFNFTVELKPNQVKTVLL